MALRLRSKVFDAFGEIPVRYTAEGKNVSPPLKWSNVPEGTREFALICEDPDAPTPRPFIHWLVYSISPNVTQLPEGLPARERIEYPVLVRQGRNTDQSIGYTGPKPPLLHGPHHYRFRLFALDAELSVPPNPGREDVLKAMEGHVIEQAELVGSYERLARRRLLASLGRVRPPASKGARSWLPWIFGGMVSTGLLAWAATRRPGKAVESSAA